MHLHKTASVILVLVFVLAILMIPAIPTEAAPPLKQSGESSWDSTWGCYRYQGTYSWRSLSVTPMNNEVHYRFRMEGTGKTTNACSGQVVYQGRWSGNYYVIYNQVNGTYRAIHDTWSSKYFYDGQYHTYRSRFGVVKGEIVLDSLWVDGKKVY